MSTLFATDYSFVIYLPFSTQFLLQCQLYLQQIIALFCDFEDESDFDQCLKCKLHLVAQLHQWKLIQSVAFTTSRHVFVFAIVTGFLAKRGACRLYAAKSEHNSILKEKKANKLKLSVSKQNDSGLIYTISWHGGLV